MKNFLITSFISVSVFMAICLVLLGICSLKPDTHTTATTEEVTFISSPLYSGDKVCDDLDVAAKSVSLSIAVKTQEEILIEETTAVEITTETSAETTTVETSPEETLAKETTSVETAVSSVTSTNIKVNDNNTVATCDSDVHKYYSIHLEDGSIYTLEYSLQDFLYDTCVEYGVENYYKLFLSLMFKESWYDPNSISSSDDYGLMQINIGNHSSLNKLLGVTNFLDPEDSILCGVYMLSGLMKTYDTVEMALMAYNMGPTGAKRCWANGIYSTQYVELTLGYLNNNLIAD